MAALCATGRPDPQKGLVTVRINQNIAAFNAYRNLSSTTMMQAK